MRHPQTFAEWKAYCKQVDAMAERITRAKHERGWALAATVGIGRCMCSLHNASIDDELKGWCAGPDGRRRLKAARAALRLLDDWTAHRIAERVINRAWDAYRKAEQQSKTARKAAIASDIYRAMAL